MKRCIVLCVMALDKFTFIKMFKIKVIYLQVCNSLLYSHFLVDIFCFELGTIGTELLTQHSLKKGFVGNVGPQNST